MAVAGYTAKQHFVSENIEHWSILSQHFEEEIFSPGLPNSSLMLIPSSVRYGSRTVNTPLVSPHSLVAINDENGDLVGWFSPERGQKLS